MPKSASTPTGSNSGGSSRTPNRTNNNYAAPNTPIASAKRPRSSMDKNMMSPAGKGGSGLEPPLEDGEPQTPSTSSDNDPLSPMHPARPLRIQESIAEGNEGGEGGDGFHRKVGQLFSPMLNLLATDGDDEGGNEEPLAEDGSPPPAEETQDDVEPEPVQPEEQAQEDYADEGDEEQHQDDEASEDEYEEEFNPYVFIASLPAYEEVATLRPPIPLPPKDPDSPPISLVLDLDETLVHCTVEPVDDADLIFPVVFNGATYQVHVRLRPHLYEFLEKIQDKYEVIVFTASQQVYADELLNRIDKEGKFIKHRMFRESCLAVEGNFLKDLNVLGRDLSKTVLVDNSPHAFGYQVDNGIPIESWFDDPRDTELLKLERFLNTLHDVPDCRDVVRRTFQTHQLVSDARENP